MDSTGNKRCTRPIWFNLGTRFENFPDLYVSYSFCDGNNYQITGEEKMSGIKISKNQMKGVLVILAVAKETLRDNYNKYLAERLHRELSLIQEKDGKAKNIL